MTRPASNLEHKDEDPYKYTGDSVSLLSKYDIPIAHLDFSYVEKCQDGKELERILHVLKSGEEGYYPELMKVVEEKLKIINPKSKFLRNLSKVLSKEEIEEEEWVDITKDLNDWVKDISKDNKELELRKGQKPPNRHEPTEIRRRKENTEEKELKPQKIKSTDYAAWDKYDADAEMLQMTLNEEKSREEAKHGNSASTKKKKKVKFNMFASDVEAKSEAKKEREKGNEYFKAGDFSSALRHYSASLECFHTVEAFNNRAVTNLKLGQYKDAILDCDGALGLEPSNLKALWRKSMALNDLGEFEEALECVEMCVDIEPNNEKIQTLATNIRGKCTKTIGVRRRIRVENVTHEEDDEEKKKLRGTNNYRKEIVPIPGTSRMPEPYFIECSPEDKKTVSEILYMKRCEQEIPSRLLDSADRSILSHVRSNEGSPEHNPSKDVHQDSQDLLNVSVTIATQDHASNTRMTMKSHRSIKSSLENISLDDKNAGGEPHRSDDLITLPEDIYSPYEFLRTWNNIRDDVSLKKHAHVIRNMNMEQIVEVIGCKLDNNMFSDIIRTLCRHFTVPGEVEKVHSVLLNFARLPRFQIISMLMSEQDRNCVDMLISFLHQHDKLLPENVRNILTT